MREFVGGDWIALRICNTISLQTFHKCNSIPPSAILLLFPAIKILIFQYDVLVRSGASILAREMLLVYHASSIQIRNIWSHGKTNALFEYLQRTFEKESVFESARNLTGR